MTTLCTTRVGASGGVTMGIKLFCICCLVIVCLLYAICVYGTAKAPKLNIIIHHKDTFGLQ